MDNPHIFTADLHDFKEKVIAASKDIPILIDFWADWCSPCHAIAPHITKVIEDLDGEVLLCKVEVDEGENMKLAGRYGLRGFPTIMLMQDGEEVARFAGSHPARWIHDWLDQHMQVV